VDAEAAYVGNDLSVNVNALNGGWRGGAILSFGPSLSVRDCNFSRLSITSCPFGGAICYRPDYKLSNGQWSTNHGLNTEAPRGRLEIVNTFISAARTTQGRGMLAAATHSDVYIANCTAAFNRCGNKKKFRGNGSVFYGDRGVELYLICNLFTDNDNVLENIGRGFQVSHHTDQLRYYLILTLSQREVKLNIWQEMFLDTTREKTYQRVIQTTRTQCHALHHRLHSNHHRMEKYLPLIPKKIHHLSYQTEVFLITLRKWIIMKTSFPTSL
jgi:hypothetical protein